MLKLCLARLTQLIIIVPCMLREVLATTTDIVQFQMNKQQVMALIKFPTVQNADLLYTHAINNPTLATLFLSFFIIAHAITAILLIIGLFQCLTSLKSPYLVYKKKKLFLLFGLTFGIASYLLVLGVFSMDYFLSWMHGINFNSDLLTYGMFLGLGLLYLVSTDFKSFDPSQQSKSS